MPNHFHALAPQWAARGLVFALAVLFVQVSAAQQLDLGSIGHEPTSLSPADQCLPTEPPRGLNGTVMAIAVSTDGSIYVGGSFTRAGEIEASTIARWIPNEQGLGQWNALSDGLRCPGCATSTVNAIVIGSDGALYAGGNFTHSGSAAVNHIARWDENLQQWQSLGSGVNSVVHALTWHEGSLYVGGEFTLAGEATASRLARWTPDTSEAGGSWSGFGAEINSSVNSIAWGPDGAVYVGGSFTQVGDMSANRIARYRPGTGGNLGAWSTLTNGINNSVQSLTWGPDGGLYAAGGFTEAGSTPANRVARWTPHGMTGGAWSSLGTGLFNDWAFTMAWTHDGQLLVGGRFSQAGGITAPRLALWTPVADGGGTWRAVGHGTNSFVLALQSAPDGAILVGGAFTSVRESSPLDELGFVHVNRIARLELGASPAADRWYSFSGLGGRVLASTRLSNGDLIVGGDFRSVGQRDMNYIARRVPNGLGTGVKWEPLGEGFNSTVLALAEMDGVLYAGGTFTHSGSQEVSRVARYNAAADQWEPLGEGVSSVVRALAGGADGDLYVGGDFTLAGGAPANRIARWRSGDQSWTALGTGVDRPVRALAWTGTVLYVGGSFWSAGEFLWRVWRAGRRTMEAHGARFVPLMALSTLLALDRTVRSTSAANFPASSVGNPLPASHAGHPSKTGGNGAPWALE